MTKKTDRVACDLIDSLQRFIDCDHSYWTCTECGCKTDTGTIQGSLRTKNVEQEDEPTRLRAENERLRAENKQLLDHVSLLGGATKT